MRLQRAGQNASEKVLLNMALKGARDRFEKGGYPALAESSFEQVGVRPVYLAENSPDFAESREKLKRASGLVIANHPGGTDIQAVLSALERKDVYFMAAAKNVERMKDVIGEEHLLPAAKDLGQLRGVMRRIEEIFAKGGLVFLFPTGGADFNGGPFEFKSGFAYILGLLKPEQMVYAFYISPEDTKKAFSGTPSGPRLGSAMLAGKMGLRAAKEKWPTVRIDERYTTADVWQRSFPSVAGSSTTTKNERLARQFLEMFENSDV